MKSRTFGMLRLVVVITAFCGAWYLASTLAWNYWPGFREQDIETCTGQVLYNGKWSDQIQYIQPVCRGLVSAHWWEFGSHFAWSGADIVVPFVGATAVLLPVYLLALSVRALRRGWRRWRGGRCYARLLRQKGYPNYPKGETGNHTSQ